MKKEVEIMELVPGAMPEYATAGSAGLDLMAQLKSPLEIWPGEVQLLHTGIAVNMLDTDMAAVLLPRSGLGHKQGIVLGNLVGLIDSDYQGEIRVSCWNRSKVSYVVHPHDRIAQMVFVPVIHPLFRLVQVFEESERADGGFGSTGK